MRHCFAVPIKDFAVAKSRLRSANVTEVSALARTLATGVIHELEGHEVTVLCESDEVSDFALSLGCAVAFTTAPGLNESVQGFYDSISTLYDRITIVHADLATPEGLGHYQPKAEVGIVTDQRGFGTNLLSVPTGMGFHFQFGDESLRLHQDEATRLGLSCEVLAEGPWIHDVDLPEDLP